MHNFLEAILDEFHITDQIDLLALSMRMNNYTIFNNLKDLRPRVIIQRNNVPEYSENILKDLADNKHYTMVAKTDTSCIFVYTDEIYKIINPHTAAIITKNYFFI